jgi:hypothetical protein
MLNQLSVVTMNVTDGKCLLLPPSSLLAPAAAATAAAAASLQSKLSEQFPAEKNRLQTQKPSAAPTYASQRMI